MPGIMMLCCEEVPSQHSIRWASFAILSAAIASRAVMFAQPQPAEDVTSTYIVFVRAERVGSEDISVTRTPTGWTITSSGTAGPPIDLVTRQLQARYTTDWKPLDLKIDATLRNVATQSTTV